MANTQDEEMCSAWVQFSEQRNRDLHVIHICRISKYSSQQEKEVKCLYKVVPP